MSILGYKNKTLTVEKVPLSDIASQFGTPCYIYSRKAIIQNWRQFSKPLEGLTHQLAFAVKANSNLAILNLFASLGAGFDIVSIGELKRVLAAGGDPKNIVFSGVGKQLHEITFALEHGIRCFNVESEQELSRLHSIAKNYNQTTNVALRLNPDVDAKTHPYISTGLKSNKFGLQTNNLHSVCDSIQPPLKLNGLAMHIGSQITELSPFSDAIKILIQHYHSLSAAGHQIQHLDIGGGLGVNYHNDNTPSIADYLALVKKHFSDLSVEVILEPGRALIGNCGALITRVEYLKQQEMKNFAIVDAGMNDLLRPALYDSWHPIQPVCQRDIPQACYDVVGPVCETADFLGKDRNLAIKEGDLLAVDIVGAYGFSMSSNYNSRCRPPEILVDGSDLYLIRDRETFDDLIAKENIPLFARQT